MAHAGTMVGGSAQTKQSGRPWPAIALAVAVVVATIAGVWLASSAGLVGGTAKPAADRSMDQIEAQRGAITLSGGSSQAYDERLNGILDGAHAAPYAAAVTLSSHDIRALNARLDAILDGAHATPYVGRRARAPLQRDVGHVPSRQAGRSARHAGSRRRPVATPSTSRNEGRTHASGPRRFAPVAWLRAGWDFEPTTKGLKVPCSAAELPAREGPYHVRIGPSDVAGMGCVRFPARAKMRHGRLVGTGRRGDRGGRLRLHRRDHRRGRHRLVHDPRRARPRRQGRGRRQCQATRRAPARSRQLPAGDAPRSPGRGGRARDAGRPGPCEQFGRIREGRQVADRSSAGGERPPTTSTPG